MKKYRMVFLSIFCCLAFAGCSKSQTLSYSQEFFTAFNHMLEADTLATDGDIEFGMIDTDFVFYLDQSSDDISLALETGSEAENNQINFYIKDGKTYLDYLGTKSSSVAENIGLGDGQKISVYNPFLDLSDEERAELFDSITLKDNTYTFQINKTNLAAYLDSYGSVSITKAVMTAKITDDEIKNLSLDITGKITMDAASADLVINLNLNVESMNQKIEIPWPDDLNTTAYQVG